MTCGVNISHDEMYISNGCCADPRWTEEEQLQWGCCLWDSGTNCLSETGDKCCLRCPTASETDSSPNHKHKYCVYGDEDKNYKCQRDCSKWQPSIWWKIWYFWQWQLGAGLVALLLTGLLVRLGMLALRCHQARQRRKSCREYAVVLALSTYRGGGANGVLKDLPCAERDASFMKETVFEERMAYIVVPYPQEADKRRIESHLNVVEDLILQGQQLVPIYLAGHGHEVCGSFFLCPSGSPDYSPGNEVSLKKWIARWRCARPGRPGGSTILLMIDCCRTDAKLGADVQAKYSAILGDEEHTKFEQSEEFNRVLIFWACSKGGSANENLVSGHGFFVQAWKRVLCSVTESRSVHIKLFSLLQSVRRTTSELATRIGKTQQPDFEPAFDASWSVMQLQPLSRSTGRLDVHHAARGSTSQPSDTEALARTLLETPQAHQLECAPSSASAVSTEP